MMFAGAIPDSYGRKLSSSRAIGPDQETIDSELRRMEYRAAWSSR